MMWTVRVIKNSPLHCSKNGAIYDETVQTIKPHHLEKAHAHNIAMVFSHPLNLSLTPEPVFAPQMGTLVSSAIIITHTLSYTQCVCVRVYGRQLY